MSQFTNYQLQQVLCVALGVNADDYKQCEPGLEFVKTLQQEGNLQVPGTLYIIYERVALAASLTKPRVSWLIRRMMDRPDDTAVIVDAVASGHKAVFLGALIKHKDNFGMWLSNMRGSRIDLTIKPVDDEYHVLVASASCFARFQE